MRDHLLVILDRADALVNRGNQMRALAEEAERQEGELDTNDLVLLETKFAAIKSADDDCQASYSTMDSNMGGIEEVLGL